MKKKNLLICLFIVFLVLIDQISKLLIVKFINLNESVILINNFLKFLYIRNTGGAFGILGRSTFLLIIITIILIYFIIKEIIKNKDNKLVLFCYSLILSGAIGNLIDRIFRHYVVDFISFTLFNREMAIFNIADIFITLGVVLYAFILIKEGSNERNNNK